MSMPVLSTLAAAEAPTTSPFDLSSFFASSVDILMSLDAMGRIRCVSPSYREITGDAPADAVGRSCLQYVAEPDIHRTAGEIAWVLTNGAETNGFENLVRGRDGGFRVISWRGRAAPDGTIAAIGRDVTEERGAEARRMTAQRMDAVTQLTGGIAHEFNNILAALLGYLELGSRITAEERTRAILCKALECGRKGAKTVEQLLATARAQQLRFERVELGALVRGMADALTAAARPHATVTCELDPRPAFVDIDPAQFHVALVHLCLNAAEAAPRSGGHVLVTTSSTWVESGAVGAAAALRPGPYVRVSVQDDGAGMDAEAAARCFEPLYTTRGPQPGRGLGLPYVHAFVAQCGGTAWIDSAPGRGTTVHLLLPLATGG